MMNSFLKTGLVAVALTGVALSLQVEHVATQGLGRPLARPRSTAAEPTQVLVPTPDLGGRRTAQIVSAPANVPGIDKPVRVIRGRFTSDLTLTNDTYWVLRGAIFIGAPARLTIQPGTRIIGETATRGTLVIERGAQIIANGNAAQPIVMTSDQPIGQRGRGDWGGLVINGNAPLNLPGGVGIGEGQTGVYGGNDPNDNSGILRYVRVEFAGIEFSPDNELNGIAFQGVGNGTIVENIQVHFNKDDGIEMFGGTVDIKRVVLTGIGDDSIDWTFGWKGRLQFAVVQQRGDDTDQGIEADNNGNNFNLEPRSEPTLFNLTMIGDPSQEFGPESTNCMRLRVGTAAIIRNFVCAGFKSQAIDVRDAPATELIQQGRLLTTHGILFQNGSGGNAHWGSSAQSQLMRTTVGGLVTIEDPLLVAPFNRAAPDWRPLPGSPALLRMPATPPNDGFFEIANFIGALGPDAEQDWTRGWTMFAQN
jgi:hypothetical protein